MQTLLLGLLAALLPALSLAGPVDINTADAMTLATELNGVGLSRAEAIIEYRNLNGSFATAEQLLEVKGIGPQVLDMNRMNIQISTSQ